MRTRPILFLDEYRFNLYTSINYVYSAVNQYTIIYQPASNGRNTSLRSIISRNDTNSMIIDSAYNRNVFMAFLETCFEKGIFENKKSIM